MTSAGGTLIQTIWTPPSRRNTRRIHSWHWKKTNSTKQIVLTVLRIIKTSTVGPRRTRNCLRCGIGKIKIYTTTNEYNTIYNNYCICVWWWCIKFISICGRNIQRRNDLSGISTTRACAGKQRKAAAWQS